MAARSSRRDELQVRTPFDSEVSPVEIWRDSACPPAPPIEIINPDPPPKHSRFCWLLRILPLSGLRGALRGDRSSVDRSESNLIEESFISRCDVPMLKLGLFLQPQRPQSPARAA